jgi:hypothetical protein
MQLESILIQEKGKQVGDEQKIQDGIKLLWAEEVKGYGTD